MAGGRWPWPWPVVGGLAGWPGRGRGSGRWPVAGGRWPGHWPWPWQPGRGRGRWPVAVSVAGPWPWPGWPATKKSYIMLYQYHTVSSRTMPYHLHRILSCPIGLEGISSSNMLPYICMMRFISKVICSVFKSIVRVSALCLFSHPAPQPKVTEAKNLVLETSQSRCRRAVNSTNIFRPQRRPRQPDLT